MPGYGKYRTPFTNCRSARLVELQSWPYRPSAIRLQSTSPFIFKCRKYLLLNGKGDFFLLIPGLPDAAKATRFGGIFSGKWFQGRCPPHLLINKTKGISIEFLPEDLVPAHFLCLQRPIKETAPKKDFTRNSKVKEMCKVLRKPNMIKMLMCTFTILPGWTGS